MKEKFGKTPLVVSIQGTGEASGKTILQFMLADFLREKGHEVFLSDAANGDAIMQGNMRRREMMGAEKDIIPMPVYIHVTKDAFADPRECLTGC